MTLEVFRSGKAKIMGNRFGGHSDCARKVNRAGLSELYTAYPSKALWALEEKNPRRRGWFEDVHFGIFIGFDRANQDTVDFLTQQPASARAPARAACWTGAVRCQSCASAAAARPRSRTCS
jgi:hypothetical protein